MSSRVEMFAALQAQAEEMGWQVEEPYDGEGQVEMLLTAPGASEQVVAGTMLQARRQLNEMGGPKDYPLDEDYDLEQEHQVEQAEIAEVLAEDIVHDELLDVEDKLAENETVQAVAKALDITATEAVNQLAYEENDPEWAREWQEMLAEEAAAGEVSDGAARDEEARPLDRVEANAAREVTEPYPSENARVEDAAMDKTASEVERARDEALETEAFESENAEIVVSDDTWGSFAAACRAERRDELAADAEAETALIAAIEGCERKRDSWEVRLERAREVLQNVVEGGNGHTTAPDHFEDISPFKLHENEPSMKSLWRNEVPRPEQFLPEVYDMSERSIIARKGDEVRVFWSQVAASVKADLETSGYEFFHTSKARANALARNSSPKLTAQRAGRVVTTTVNGREVAPEGWKIRVSGNGLPVQFFQSVREAAWDGFQLSLVRRA